MQLFNPPVLQSTSHNLSGCSSYYYKRSCVSAENPQTSFLSAFFHVFSWLWPNTSAAAQNIPASLTDRQSCATAKCGTGQLKKYRKEPKCSDEKLLSFHIQFVTNSGTKWSWSCLCGGWEEKKKSTVENLRYALISCLWHKNLREATGISTVQMLEMTFPELWVERELKEFQHQERSDRMHNQSDCVSNKVWI